MAAISQTIYLEAFYRMKSFVFWFEFHWSLFLSGQLTITQHWFKKWLGAVQATSHYMNQCWLSLLTHICGTRGDGLNAILHMCAQAYLYFCVGLVTVWISYPALPLFSPTMPYRDCISTCCIAHDTIFGLYSSIRIVTHSDSCRCDVIVSGSVRETERNIPKQELTPQPRDLKTIAGPQSINNESVLIAIWYIFACLYI